MTGVTLLSALMMAVGLAGVVIPVVPGLVLVWGGVLVWALERQQTTGWAALALASVLLACGTALKYLLPGRRLRAAGVPLRTTFAGAALGVVGFFVIPVVGLLVGFVLGVYLVELHRLDGHAAAWPSTKRALAAVGWSMLIELLTGLLIVGSWLVALAVA